ncbi:hypothetical protein ASG89_01180 [Paenibacillus sp. Soil766]|uniref:NUDIX domain-containing protein n=1 Tax=Paenibacillus sp. Soil766 TaxID=1736404 RepID=UPI00070ED108|nr:NUDIX domain-containing protein [Paenibacillus sp. Soil766]KRF10181.1 hypothetical protein ASG89_01180 [Paenibacillus sp. Soil766]
MYIKELRDRTGDLPLILVRPTLILTNNEGEILLVRHNDDSWGLPGGLLEPGESVEDALRREMVEELNIIIKDMDFFHIFSDARFYIKSRTHYVAITYTTNKYEGTIQPDRNEVIEYGYFKPNKLPEKTMEMIKIIIKEFTDTEQN